MRSTSPKALPKFSQRAWPDYYPSAFRCRLEQCLCRGCLPPSRFAKALFLAATFADCECGVRPRRSQSRKTCSSSIQHNEADAL